MHKRRSRNQKSTAEQLPPGAKAARAEMMRDLAGRSGRMTHKRMSLLIAGSSGAERAVWRGIAREARA